MVDNRPAGSAESAQGVSAHASDFGALPGRELARMGLQQIVYSTRSSCSEAAAQILESLGVEVLNLCVYGF